MTGRAQRRGRDCPPPGSATGDQARSSSSSTPASPVRATRSSCSDGSCRARALHRARDGSASVSTRVVRSSCHRGLHQAVYLERLSRAGGVVEERILGTRAAQPERAARADGRRRGADRSPRTTRSFSPSGQRYLGCRFPAEPAYARAITDSAPRRVGALPRGGRSARPCGHRLRRRCGRGRRVDVVRDRAEPPQGRHDPSVPALQFLAGAYDAEQGDVHHGRGDRSTSSPPTISSPRR